MASANTKIKYISDDLLLRELQLDPLLQRYSVVMIDDAHCRTLSTDLLLSLLKRILQKRTDLRVVVCGATAAVLQIVAFFNSGPAPAQDDTSGSLSIEHGVAKLIEIDDSPHTAELQRRDEPAQDYFKATVDTVFEVLATEDPGDILVVLTGKAEVYEAIGAIQTKAMELGTSAPELRLQPLHHGLGRDHQRDLFEAVPANARRIVVSDSIAETGVRLDNISFVVDCGYTKIRMYDSKSSVDCLVQMPISQMAAAQRAKQAGHSRAGKCFQVFTTEESDNLALQDIPEIQRSNFSPALLLLTNLGVANPVKFEYLTRPPDELMMVAAEYLLAIGAINEGIRLTQPLGLQIADIPLEPRMAKALLTSPEYACTSEMLSIAAMVDTHMAPWASDADVEDGFALHQRLFGVRESDHLTLLNIYTAFVDPKVGRNSRQWCEKHSLSYQTLSFADKIRSQLEKYLQKHNIDTRSSLVAAQSPTTAATKEESGKILRKCLLSGFCDNVAKRQADGSFRTVRGGRTVHAHKGSFASVCFLFLFCARISTEGHADCRSGTTTN